jgi:hypothetical protein
MKKTCFCFKPGNEAVSNETASFASKSHPLNGRVYFVTIILFVLL